MKKKIIIVGSGIAGQDVLREIQQSPELDLEVVGFIDDDPNKKGQVVESVPILGDRTTLTDQVQSLKVQEVIIAIPSADGEQISEIVKICSDLKIAFRIVPRVKEIIEGHAHLATLRNVRVEDLLGRPVIKSDIAELKDFFEGKTVLVTGAAGSIGSELSRQISAYQPKHLVLLDWWENGMYELQLELLRNFPDLNLTFVIANVQNREKISRIMEHHKPDYVFHAAAYKHVPLMEDNPLEAVRNNVFGTLNVAEEAVAHQVEKFVIVSTDKAADPVNIMGATKFITESIGKMLNGQTKFMAVRFGNVLDSFGSVIPIFRRQIEHGGPVTVTDPRMTRFFMTIPEAAQLILKAGSMGQGGELFVLDMGEPVKIIDLAENMIRLSGLIPGEDIKIIFTGIRKGEKLDEVLFTSKEQLQATQKDKIFVTESDGIKTTQMPELLNSLRACLELDNAQEVREQFHHFIPEFPLQ